MTIIPIHFSEACEFVRKHHRHHGATVGHKFSIALSVDGENINGVAIVGRPVSRMLDDGWTLEVLRCCTDGTPNACSKLYASCWRAAKAMGYRKLITYVLSDESGTSLIASGWKVVHQTSGGSWSRKNRPRVDKHPTQSKLRFEIANQE